MPIYSFHLLIYAEWIISFDGCLVCVMAHRLKGVDLRLFGYFMVRHSHVLSLHRFQVSSVEACWSSVVPTVVGLCDDPGCWVIGTLGDFAVFKFTSLLPVSKFHRLKVLVFGN
mmetsp:Transcript_15102/g.26521  ORF Transcript_15102/g.26521 Transcript_15102/m.26521 type:complete len:113 (-) Transcript_15102:1993-2331(-)